MDIKKLTAETNDYFRKKFHAKFYDNRTKRSTKMFFKKIISIKFVLLCNSKKLIKFYKLRLSECV